MKRIINLCFVVFLFYVLFVRCTDEPKYDMQVVDHIAPGSVSDIVVENLPGAARITYSLPADDDLLAVKARYSFSDEEDFQEVYSSAFTDTITINGFPDTGEKKVQLICVDKNNNESEPVETLVKPLAPAVHAIGASVNIRATFGGVLVTWENLHQEYIGVALYVEDSFGEMSHNYTYYTNQANGQYAFRGFEDMERKFEVQIQDKFGRLSNPRDTVLKPFFEERIPSKDDFGKDIWTQFGYVDRSVLWRGDNATHARPLSNAWDYDYKSTWNTGPPGHALIDYTEEPEHNGIMKVPMYFTIDLGKQTILSRHKYWLLSGRLAFNNLRNYEIWATNEKPKGQTEFENKMESLAYWTEWPEVGGTDAWKNDWVKIATCECIPPSGATEPHQVTEEDHQWVANNGFEFEIDLEYTTQPFRYLRFVSTTTNWSNVTIMHAAEFEFWGQVVD